MHWCALLARLTPAFGQFFRTNWWYRKEVSIFCLRTNWINLVTCSKIEFRELCYCSARWTKSVKFTLLIAVHKCGLSKKNFFGLWQRKNRELENNYTIFEKCFVNPFHGQTIKENFFLTGSREDALSESKVYWIRNSFVEIFCFHNLRYKWKRCLKEIA